MNNQGYERWSEPLMMFLSVAFVVAMVSNALAPGSVPSLLEGIIVVVFAVDLGVRVHLSERRLQYLTSHWFDVVIVVVPLLRPLRVVQAARILQVLKIGTVGGRLLSRVNAILSTNGTREVLVVALCLVVIGAAAAVVAEAGAGGPINGFWEACWWALATVTTVGYGDFYPVTAAGRAIGVLMMSVGVGVFGILTASIAANFVKSNDDELRVQLERIEAKLNAIESKIPSPEQQARAESQQSR